MADVALFTRAWIEILKKEKETRTRSVALFTRAWIEMLIQTNEIQALRGRPLHEGVD